MSNKELDEAIATLQVMETNPFDTKWKRALRLGTEALEREKLFRERVPRRDWELFLVKQRRGND